MHKQTDDIRSVTSQVGDHQVVHVEDLRTLARGAAAKAGLSGPHLDHFVEGLVEADLRGVETHGVVRLPAYVRGFVSGAINPSPRIAVIRQRGAVAALDGDNGIGMVTGRAAMEHAIALARDHGLGFVVIRNGNHTGMLAQYVLRAVDQGMFGYFVSNGPAVMPPWGGTDARISNNPVAYGFPTDTDFPIVLDMACSAAARGKIRLAASRNENIPIDWALDAHGNPTTDPHAAMVGTILPMARHKGYGLAVVHEILSGVLSGALLSMEISRAFLMEGATSLDSWQCGHAAMALDIASLIDIAQYKSRIHDLIAKLRDTPKLAGVVDIELPGEPEWKCRTERLRAGVPLSPVVVTMLNELATSLSLATI